MTDEAGKTPTPAAPSAEAPPLASITDFQRLTFRIGTVQTAIDHPQADRLLIVTVDVGEPTPRQLVAGIRGSYQAADLVGKRVVVVTNLKPATLRGVESQGMILATQDASGLTLIVPERAVQPGSPVK